jgi:hypothetical protein
VLGSSIRVLDGVGVRVRLRLTLSLTLILSLHHCSRFSYPGENFVENVRSVLAELMMLVLDTREWEAECRDALYPGVNTRYVGLG